MQEQAIKLAVDCILDAAKKGGELGAPSGAIYAAFSEHGMSLTVYQQLIDAMVSQKLITVSGHCIKLTKEV